MSQLVDVAVAGLSTLLGETFLEVLKERQFPVNELFLLGDEEDVGKKFEFRDHYLKVTLAESFDFSRVKLLFLLDVPQLAAAVGERAAAAGCTVIDLSGYFYGMNGVPLVVPEINSDVIRGMGGQIIATPAGAAAPVALVLNALQRQAGLRRLSVTVLAPVSWAGREGVEELAKQTADLLNARPIEPERFAKQSAFNLLPQVGELTDSGATSEEELLESQLRLLLEIPDISLDVSVIQTPVFFGSGVVLHLELAGYLSVQQVIEHLGEVSGVEVMTGDEYPTAVTEAIGQDTVYVGRIRETKPYNGTLGLWLVYDQARKGGVTNAIQIGEAVLKSYM